MKTYIGEISEIYIENGTAKASIRAGKQLLPVSLFLLLNARVGDMVEVESNIAVGRLEPMSTDQGRTR